MIESTALVPPPMSDPDAEALRRSHIAHEASIKSIGILYFLGSAFCLSAGLYAIFDKAPQPLSERAIVAVVFLCLAGVQIASGIGIRRFKEWARVVVGILSAIGLLAIPVGTIINGYILYLLFSKKGAVVFSEKYQKAIAATPDVKYRSSIIVRIAGYLFLAVFVLILALGLFGLLTRR